MRKFLILLVFLQFGATLFSQDINVFGAPNFRLYQFNAGVFEQIYYQQTADVFLGNEYVCFVDSKGDIFIHYKGKQILMGQSYNTIHNTDNLLVMQTATVLRVFDRGVKHVLTSNVTGYAVGDSLVVFQEFIGGGLKYYYQDEVREIAMIVGDYPFKPGQVGDNLFVYADNAGNYSVFWRGKFQELLSTNLNVEFDAGQDVIAFNDPKNGTFTVFDNGYIVDAEPQHALTYECGNNFVYYKDAGGNNKVYREERVTELGFDLQNIMVRDSLIYFRDVGLNKIWYNEKVYQIYNDQVVQPQIDGGIMAYINKWGGVSAFVRGKEIEITRQRVEDFRLQGSTIMLKFSPSAFSVWWNYEMYDF
jgi:hypothetical protein